jgi:nucleoid DNA-binding protein
VEPQIAWGFAQSIVDIMIERLDRGEEIKVRGLGTFCWTDVPERRMPNGRDAPGGRKLKFKPSKRFRHRRTNMADNDEGMSKYGVQTDDNKTKTAEEGTTRICPICGKELDDAGACPVHGTEPFEPNDE